MGPVRRAKRHGRQSGMTLIEVLISILVISLILGAATTGIIMLNRTTAAANSAARANVLATGMAEVLKSIEYVECTRGNLEDEYQALFNQYQQDVREQERLLKPFESATVDEVAVQGLAEGQSGFCQPLDPGVQTISFTVTSAVGLPQERERTVQVVKRNPDYSDALFAEFEACLETSLLPAGTPKCDFRNIPNTTGGPLAIFSLDARESSPLARILEYAYDCGDGGAVLRTAVPDDPNITCEYQAPTSSSPPTIRTITLTITDTAGRKRTTSREVVIPAAPVARPAPTGAITATCSAPATCTFGTTVDGGVSFPSLTATATSGLTVNFSAAQVQPLEGRIVRYEWDFGVGQELGGAGNTATGVTASYTYIRSCSPCRVKLTVTDDVEQERDLQFFVFWARPGTPPPEARFGYSPSSPMVAPQLVSFDGRASTASGGGPVTSYFWEFGVGGATSTLDRPTYRYTTPGTYNVRLTVTAGGLQASIVQQVVIAPALPSVGVPGFRLTGSAGFGGQGLFFRGEFRFAWSNVPRSPGDIVEYEVDMRKGASPPIVGWICPTFSPRQVRYRTNPSLAFEAVVYRPTRPDAICLWQTYEWRVRSHRISPTEGTITSTYSQWFQETVRDTP